MIESKLPVSELLVLKCQGLEIELFEAGDRTQLERLEHDPLFRGGLGESRSRRRRRSRRRSGPAIV